MNPYTNNPSSSGGSSSLTEELTIKKVNSGAKAIASADSKILTIDGGTDVAEVLSILIKGIIGKAWHLQMYVPAEDGVTVPAAGDLRYEGIYDGTETLAGLLGGHAIEYNMFMVFTNDGVGSQTINDVVFMYRSSGALTMEWED